MVNALAMVTDIQATLVTVILLDPMYMYLNLVFTNVRQILNLKLILPLSQKLKPVMFTNPMVIGTLATVMVSVTQHMPIQHTADLMDMVMETLPILLMLVPLTQVTLTYLFITYTSVKLPLNQKLMLPLNQKLAMFTILMVMGTLATIMVSVTQAMPTLHTADLSAMVVDTLPSHHM